MRLLIAAALVAVLAAPAGASAAEDLVVRNQGAVAVIEREPFNLSFRDEATGRTVLRQVPTNPAPAPDAKLLPTRAGTQEVAKAGLYQPLGFQVGGELKAPNQSIFAGNILLGAQSGVVFSPQRVTDAVPEDGGYRLTLATSRPDVDVILRVTPDEGRAIRVRAELSQPSGVVAIGDSFVAGPDEAFRGFGGQRDAIDQRGRSFYGWTEEEGGYRLAYYPQNLFVSSAGYGFLLNETELSTWHMAADDPGKWQVDVQGASIDYTVAVGDAPTAIATLEKLNGSHVLPAPWALEPTLSQPQIVGGDSIENYQARVEADVARLEKERDLPVSSYAYESWRGLPEETVRRTNARLRALGIHPVGYVRPMIYVDGFFNTQQDYDEVHDGNMATRDAAGRPYLQAGIFGFPTIHVDFTNPDARQWWKRWIRRMLDLGFDGFMQDFGEGISPDQHFANGQTGQTMHNAYPVLYHQLTREVVEEWQREHPERETVYFYTRAGASGRKGSAAYENGTFPGDESASWTTIGGLPTIFPDMLSRAIGGAVGFNTDIGGYVDVGRGAPTVADNFDFGNATGKELYLRWTQAAVFMPYFRVHNNQGTGVKMPWSYDAETRAAWSAAARLHTRAIPLIRDVWKRFPKTGLPPTTPMWLAYPGVPEAKAIVDQWMVGEDLLVAPVITEGATKRDVWFPAGCWEHGETGERFAGGATRTVPAPMVQLPWFVRCGTTPVKASAEPSLGLRSPRRCLSRRRFTIRLQAPRGERLRRATVKVGGRRVAVLRRAGRLTAVVDLRRRPRGKVRVEIRAVTRAGRVVRAERVYRTCAPRPRNR